MSRSPKPSRPSFFGEILSYSGYRFHRNHEAAAAISRLIESARNEAEKIYSADPDLNSVEHQNLKERLESNFASETRGEQS